MGKILELIVFVSLAMQVAPPMPGQQTGTAGNSSNEEKKERNATDTSTEKSVPIKPKIAPTNPKDEGHDVGTKNKEQSVKLMSVPPITIVEKQKTPLDYVFDWGPWAFSLCLVAVGVIGVILAHRTLKTMDRQAGLMETQARLMQAPFDQLIDLRDWITCRPYHNRMHVQVCLVNLSNYPVTISTGTIKIIEIGGHTRHELGDMTFLVPDRPSVIEMDVSVTDEEQQRGYVAFSVIATFTVVHRITKQGIVQRLTGQLAGREDAMGWNTHFTTWTHMNPEPQTESQPEQGEKPI